jgi:hypothetical protein
MWSKYKTAVAILMGSISSGTRRARDRSIEELELERDGVLIELLAMRSGGEKAAAASGGTPARSK